ncbi:MAG TPA: DUF370 domain-containing protein [Clostridiales bacterium]|nr:DUF370 domain-containing protein [Clostridiales bacterium]
MILHLGGDAVVPMEYIIAIFDMENSCDSAVNREFINIARSEGIIKNISEDSPKSLVLAEINKKTMVFLSPISSVTLMKRSRNAIDISYNMLENKGDTK